jgi:hypothetical protein
MLKAAADATEMTTIAPPVITWRLMFTTSHAVCPDNAFQDETPQDETPHRFRPLTACRQ